MQQQSHYLQLETQEPLPGYLYQINGSFSLTKPFVLRAFLTCKPTELILQKWLHQTVRICIGNTHEPYPQYFHGIITQCQHHYKLNRFTLLIEPQVVLLDKTPHRKIFTKLSVIEIIEKILQQHSLINFNIENIENLNFKKSIQMQYNETDLAFITRLLLENNLFYYFKSTQHNTTIIFSPQESYLKSPNYHISEPEYFIQAPQLIATLHQENHYVSKSNCPSLLAGTCINNHYFIIRNHFKAYQALPFANATTPLKQQSLINKLTLIKNNTPLHLTKGKPLLFPSAQLAQISAPNQQEYYINYDTEFNIRYSWQNQFSSYWVPKTEIIASKTAMSHFIPDTNQLAIIHYLHGNPNTPIINGCLYKNPYDEPFTLPASADKNGFQLGNQFYFNDNPNKMGIYLSAINNMYLTCQKSMHESILQDKNEQINNGDALLSIKKGHFNLTAQSIQLSCKNSQLVIDEQHIALRAKQIQLATPSSSTGALLHQGDMHVCPQLYDNNKTSPHIGGPIITGSPDVFIQGKSAARTKDVAKCQFINDHIKTGANHILINNRFAAVASSLTMHQGKCLPTNTSVIAQQNNCTTVDTKKTQPQYSFIHISCSINGTADPNPKNGIEVTVHG